MRRQVAREGAMCNPKWIQGPEAVETQTETARHWGDEAHPWQFIWKPTFRTALRKLRLLPQVGPGFPTILAAAALGGKWRRGFSGGSQSRYLRGGVAAAGASLPTACRAPS
jgi:hypothetical protein